MNGEGVRVPFSWRGSAFYTYLSMTEGPMHQLLMVKNLPPPLFSESTFITVHQAKYDGTRQLHLATKNYIHNYSLSAGQHQNQQIPYERALRNLTVLMFSHYINHLENTETLEGHWTLMVHKSLTVATTTSTIKGGSSATFWPRENCLPKNRLKRFTIRSMRR